MSKKRRRINYFKLVTTSTILIAIIVLSVMGIKKITTKISNNTGSSRTAEKVEQQVTIPEDKTINLVAIGDIMCHNTNYQTAYNANTKTYDFSPAFVNVAKYVEKGDITIGNLETTFAGKR